TELICPSCRICHTASRANAKVNGTARNLPAPSSFPLRGGFAGGPGRSWVGTWKHQFRSILEITSEANGRIEGTFRTALEDSGFHGQTVAVWGACSGDCIGFSSASASPTGDRVVS